MALWKTGVRRPVRVRLDDMLITIPEVDLLSARDEVRLARTIEAGLFAAESLAQDRRPCGASEEELRELVGLGQSAREEFHSANLRLVASLAHRWARRTSLPVDELLQEGCVGLGEAILRWDHGLGLRFTTFAFPLVNWAISGAAMVRCGELHATISQARGALRLQRHREELQNQLSREVSAGELARHLGHEELTVARGLQLARPAPLGSETEGSPPLLPEQDSSSASIEALTAWLALLPIQERVVLQARFGLGEPVVSQVALAERLGVSASTVRRIEQRALNKARRMLSAP